jgi:hypothetical protein
MSNNGVAPDAKLCFIAFSLNRSPVDLGDWIAQSHAFVSSNSWEFESGREEEYDEMAYSVMDRLVVFAAGKDAGEDHDGFTPISSPAMAKNGSCAFSASCSLPRRSAREALFHRLLPASLLFAKQFPMEIDGRRHQ